MSLEWMIYLAGMVDKLVNLLGIYQFVFLIATLVMTLAAMFSSWEYNQEGKFLDLLTKNFKALKSGFIVFIVATVMIIIIPSEKTIYLIAATSVSKEIIQSKGVQTLYDKTFKVLEGKLDAQLDAQIKKLK